MSRFKTKAQKNRERLDQQEKKAKERQLQKRIDALAPDIKKEGVNVWVPTPKWRPVEKFISSLNNGVEPVQSKKTKPKYEGEMAVRENKAQKEIVKKQKRVAPIYNKGGYMYITDETNPKDIGRKTSAD